MELARPIELREAGKYAEAAVWLNSWLSSHPRDAPALSLLAHVLMLARKDDEAQSVLKRALAVGPQLACVQRNLARLLLKRAQPAESLAAAKAAYAAAPGDAENCVMLSAAYSANQLPNEALVLIERALQIAPDYAEAHANRALLRLRSKDYSGALADAERSVALKPHMTPLWALLANLRHQANDLQGAVAAMEAARRQEPANAAHLVNLGEFQRLNGQGDDAVATLRLAVALAPANANAWTNYGTALQAQGHTDEAHRAYEEALRLDPTLAAAARNLALLAGVSAETHWKRGNASYVQGDAAAAEASYRQAISLRPDLAVAHCNLAKTLFDLRRMGEAEASCRRAIELAPGLAPAHGNLGMILQDLHRLDEAAACQQRAIEIDPAQAKPYGDLGTTAHLQGRPLVAEAMYRRAIDLDPRYAKAHSDLTMTLLQLGRVEDAVHSARCAVEIDPLLVEAHSNLGAALTQHRQYCQAEASLHRAIELRPSFAHAYANLGNTLVDMGRPVEGEASYRSALRLKPDFTEAHSSLLFTMGFSGTVSPEAYLQEAKAWEARALGRYAETGQEALPPAGRSRSGRRLRIGYVSGDLRQHVVSKFMEPILRHHDHSRVEVTAYPTSPLVDAVSERLRTLVDHWEPLFGLNDEAARRRILADGIDVLVDLSGHTRHGRLGLFVRRSAPVQAHYLGYFASTGLSQMDYWIGDAVTLPESDEAHFCEEPWRLPRVSMSYQGDAEVPSSRWRPDQDGTLWLGSFNNLNKVTPATIVLWARVLHALPEGKFLMKTGELGDPVNRERIAAAFAAHGIADTRLELRGRTADLQSHMALYDRLDVALDPVGGMSGSTTTCDTLWMGVPVITVAGGRMAQRVTSSMVTAIGHPEWIGRNEDDYVDKAVALARDVAGRKAMRFTQRDAMRASALCDGAGLAQALESAYEEMFKRKLAGAH